MKTYVGLAIADSMFPVQGVMTRRPVTAEEIHGLAGEIVSCLNPSHRATLDALRVRHGLAFDVPEKPPVIALAQGDQILVLSVRGLPRLTDRHEYTAEEVAGAAFAFGLWSVLSLASADQLRVSLGGTPEMFARI